MTTISVRPARPEESRKIGAFFQEATDGIADYIWSTMAEEGEGLLDVAERRFRQTSVEFSYVNAMIADEDGEAVGMTLGFPMHVDPTAEPCDDPVLAPYVYLELDNSYYLAAFTVSESHRNRGIGSALMAEFEKQALSRGYNQTSLIVLAENKAGRRLYERLGFREVDRTQIVPHPMIHATGDVILLAKDLVA